MSNNPTNSGKPALLSVIPWFRAITHRPDFVPALLLHWFGNTSTSMYVIESHDHHHNVVCYIIARSQHNLDKWLRLESEKVYSLFELECVIDAARDYAEVFGLNEHIVVSTPLWPLESTGGN